MVWPIKEGNGKKWSNIWNLCCCYLRLPIAGIMLLKLYCILRGSETRWCSSHGLLMLGGQGCKIPLDLHMEHITKTLRNLSANVPGSIDRIGKLINVQWKRVLKSFSVPDNKLRVQIIHFGPSNNIDSYIQETGRGERDGNYCKALLL